MKWENKNHNNKQQENKTNRLWTANYSSHAQTLLIFTVLSCCHCVICPKQAKIIKSRGWTWYYDGELCTIPCAYGFVCVPYGYGCILSVMTYSTKPSCLSAVNSTERTKINQTKSTNNNHHQGAKRSREPKEGCVLVEKKNVIFSIEFWHSVKKN